MLLALSCDFINYSDIKQVVQVVSVDFEELDFHAVLVEIGLLFPVLNLAEDKVEDPGHNTDLLVGKANGAASSHGVRLSTTCLAIGKDCRVVALEAT